MTRVTTKIKPIFVQESDLIITRFTAHQSSNLRGKLARGVYWIQPVPRGKTHWNEALLADFLVNGDRPEHQRLVEEYISTLPKVA